jgi:hypothetical protein
MTKLRLAVVLPGFVVGLALPAWAADPASEQNPNSAAAAQSEQKSTDSLSKDRGLAEGNRLREEPGRFGQREGRKEPWAHCRDGSCDTRGKVSGKISGNARQLAEASTDRPDGSSHATVEVA